MPLPKRRGYRHYDTKSQTSILSFWSRSALISLQESNYRHRRAEPKRLKFPCYLFELRADFYLLWAALFTCTALSAQTRKMVAGPGSRPLYSYIGSSPFFSGWRPHCMPQNKRGYPPHRGRACNNRKQCKESGRRNGTPGYPLIYSLFFHPDRTRQRISGHLHILRKLLSVCSSH